MYLPRDEGVMMHGQGCFSCLWQVVTQQANQLSVVGKRTYDRMRDDLRLFYVLIAASVFTNVI